MGDVFLGNHKSFEPAAIYGIAVAGQHEVCVCRLGGGMKEAALKAVLLAYFAVDGASFGRYFQLVFECAQLFLKVCFFCSGYGFAVCKLAKNVVDLVVDCVQCVYDGACLFFFGVHFDFLLGWLGRSFQLRRYPVTWEVVRLAGCRFC